MSDGHCQDGGDDPAKNRTLHLDQCQRSCPGGSTFVGFQRRFRVAFCDVCGWNLFCLSAGRMGWVLQNCEALLILYHSTPTEENKETEIFFECEHHLLFGQLSQCQNLRNQKTWQPQQCCDLELVDFDRGPLGDFSARCPRALRRRANFDLRSTQKGH